MVGNCSEIGINLQRIVKRLMANDALVNLLYYTDKDPLSQPTLSAEQKQEEIFEKLIKVVPRVGPKETATSLISIRVENGVTNPTNNEYRNIKIGIEVFVPLTQWIMKGTNLRPFAIMGEIEKTLRGKRVEGLGTISGGNFSLNFLTDEISCYMQEFWIITNE